MPLPLDSNKDCDFPDRSVSEKSGAGTGDRSHVSTCVGRGSGPADERAAEDEAVERSL